MKTHLHERPNVVFLMLDTVSADHLRLYGGSVRMRNLETMGREGVVYKNAISPGTYTLTSHVSLFTGKRVRRIRSLTKNPIRNSYGSTDPLFLKNLYIKENELTLARQMSYLGYKTALFSNNPFITRSTGLSTGFTFVKNIFLENKLRYHKTTLRIIGNDFLRENLTKLAYHLSSMIPEKRLDDLYIELRERLNLRVCRETGAYLLDQGAELTNRITDEYLSKTGELNHFLFINYMEGHEGYPTGIITKEHVSQDRWMYVSGMIDGSGVDVLRKAYAARLGYLDTRVGELMEMLKARGVLENAVVIFVSDHGQAFMEHGQLYHTLFPYNEISHVPLITARFIDGRQASERRGIEKNVSIQSLYRSILDVGYRRSEVINGSMLNNEHVFSDHTGMLDVWDIPLLKRFKKRSKNAGIIYKTKRRYNTSATAVYSKNYKLIHYYNSKMKDELYDLSEDPSESENIINQNRSIALDLLRANAV